MKLLKHEVVLFAVGLGLILGGIAWKLVAWNSAGNGSIRGVEGEIILVTRGRRLEAYVYRKGDWTLAATKETEQIKVEEIQLKDVK